MTFKYYRVLHLDKLLLHFQILQYSTLSQNSRSLSNTIVFYTQSKFYYTFKYYSILHLVKILLHFHILQYSTLSQNFTTLSNTIVFYTQSKFQIDFQILFCSTLSNNNTQTDVSIKFIYLRYFNDSSDFWCDKRLVLKHVLYFTPSSERYN